MDTNLLIMGIAAIILLGIVFYFVRSLIMAALVTVLIVVVFRIGWIYTSEDVIRLLRLDKVMDPAKVEDFRIFYDDFEGRREQNPILLPEEVDKTVREELRDKVDAFLDKYREEAGE